MKKSSTCRRRQSTSVRTLSFILSMSCDCLVACLLRSLQLSNPRLRSARCRAGRQAGRHHRSQLISTSHPVQVKIAALTSQPSGLSWPGRSSKPNISAVPVPASRRTEQLSSCSSSRRSSCSGGMLTRRPSGAGAMACTVVVLVEC